MASILLGFHMVGALVTGLLVLRAIAGLLKNKTHIYRSTAVQLGYGLCYQVMSGSLLAVFMKQKTSSFLFCSKIGIYLGIVGVVELLLFMKMRSRSMDFFPVRITVTSFIISIIATISTAFYLQF